jgi:hypothetical protein
VPQFTPNLSQNLRRPKSSTTSHDQNRNRRGDAGAKSNAEQRFRKNRDTIIFLLTAIYGGLMIVEE